MRWALSLLLAGLALLGSSQVVAWSTKVGQHTDESGGSLSAWPHLMAGFTSAGSMTLSRLDPVTGDLVWRSVAGPGTVTAVVQESVQRVHLFGTSSSGRAQVHTFNSNNGNLLGTVDLGEFQIEWAQYGCVFGKNEHTSVLLRFDMPTRTVTWSRTGPMIVAMTDAYGIFALEQNGAGYTLLKLRESTGEVERTNVIQGVGGFLSRVHDIRFGSYRIGVGSDFAQIVFLGDAPGGRGRLLSCWANPNDGGPVWQYVDLSSPGYLARLGYVGYYMGVREETASGSQKSMEYGVEPSYAYGTPSSKRLLGTYLHESGLESVYVAGSRRDISLWRVGALGEDRGHPVGVDGGLNVDDIPIAKASNALLGDYVLFEARDQGQSSVYVMRPQKVSAGFGAIGGDPATFGVRLSSPATKPVTFKISAVPGQPAGAGTQTISFAVGDEAKSVQIPTLPVSEDQFAFMEMSYNNIRHRVYGQLRRPKMALFTMSANYGRGGDVLTGTVELTGQAPVGGMPVQISDSSGLVGTPAFVTVPHGQREATFPITLFAPTVTTTVTVTALDGQIQLRRTLTLLRSELHAISLSNAWVKGGTALALTIDLDAPAPAGGLVCSVATEGAVLPRPPVTVPLGSRTFAATLYTSVVTADTPSIVHVSAQGRVRTKAVLVRP